MQTVATFPESAAKKTWSTPRSQGFALVLAAFSAVGLIHPGEADAAWHCYFPQDQLSPCTYWASVPAPPSSTGWKSFRWQDTVKVTNWNDGTVQFQLWRKTTANVVAKSTTYGLPPTPPPAASGEFLGSSSQLYRSNLLYRVGGAGSLYTTSTAVLGV